MDIILVRHGQTAWNYSASNNEERFRGQEDVPLDATGLEQARRTGRFIAARWQPVACYASPLSRAVQTAQAIVEACGLESVQPVADLIDINYGDWARHTVSEVMATWPEAYRIWREDPAHAHPPGGESLVALQQRSLAAVREILARHSQIGTLVIVGHTVLNRVLILGLLGISLDHFWQLGQDPCGISFLHEGWGRYHLEWLNETVHLDGLQA